MTDETVTDLHKRLLEEAQSSQALLFGDFTLKSGRQSPYFFNSGRLCSGKAVSTVAQSYAEMIVDMNIEFDVIFGAAYKGIPLAATVAAKYYEISEKSCEYAYNRKERKDHGDGGMLAGAEISGRRVLLIDDVCTSGKAVREVLEIMKQNNATIVGLVLLFDRQERVTDDSNESAVLALAREIDVPVKSVISLENVLEYSKGRIDQKLINKIQDYRIRYGVKLKQ